MKTQLHTIASPALIPYYNIKDSCVVVIDILRATSSICVAFSSGVERILPVMSPEECRLYKEFDFITAAERNGIKLEGFDLGNSPFEYRNDLLRGKSIAMTTTNGTKAIRGAREAGASEIVVGSFLNFQKLIDYLAKSNKNIFLLCAGWKDKVNLEDTLFAGAVAHALSHACEINCDSTLMAIDLYQHHQHNLYDLVIQSSHAKRFKALHEHEDDVRFCLQLNIYSSLPILSGEYLLNAEMVMK